MPPLDAGLSAAERERQYFWHALPSRWWDMSYDDFLTERRGRIARVIRRGWEQLTHGHANEQVRAPTVAELIAAGESGGVEYKATLRTNLHTGQPDEKMHLAALKSIAGFLNTNGGVLLIGVADDGQVLGVGADGFQNEDRMALHLVSLIRDRIGEVFLPYVHPHFEDQGGERILVIRCERGLRPAFLKDGSQQRFYVRGGNATAELGGASITDYVKQRFP